MVQGVREIGFKELETDTVIEGLWVSVRQAGHLGEI